MTRAICLSVSSVSVRRLIESDETMSDITGSASGSTLVMTGGSSSGGGALDRAGHLLADVIGRVVEVALEDEPDGDPGRAFGDARLNLVDAGDAADGLFHRLDDGGGDFVRAGAGQAQLHADCRRVRFRKEIDAEVAEREQTQHDQRHHEHRRGDGPADAEFREHWDLPYFATATCVPSESVSTSVIATGSPSFTPLAISIRSPSRSPTCSSRAARRSPCTTNTRFTP